MYDNEIIIKVSPHTEGGLNYDVYLDPEDVELPDDCDDGGICTSGMHTEECEKKQNDSWNNPYACEGCDEAMAKPYNREDWTNAFDMARDQALDLLFPKA